MSDDTRIVSYDPADPRAAAAAARIAAANAAETRGGDGCGTVSGSPVVHRLVLMEIWRPQRYVGSQGPRVFWRECLVDSVRPDGSPRWGTPAPWRTMNREFAANALHETFFTLDTFPGVTFCVRRAQRVGISDWLAIRTLREAARSDATPDQVSELDGT